MGSSRTKKTVCRWLALGLGAVALVGCAGGATPTSSAPASKPAWTPPLPVLSPLYSDLRDEGPLSDGLPLQEALETARVSGFLEEVDRLLGEAVRHPTSSPDGAHFAFIVPRQADGSGEIWVSQADGSLPYLLHAGLARAERAVWLDEGSSAGRIYFSSRGRVWSLRPILLVAEETQS